MQKDPLRRDLALALLLFWLLLLLGSALSSSTSPSLLASRSTNTDSWPTFHHDSARSGYTSDSAPTAPRILWKYQTGAQIWSSPIVDRGMVYVLSQDGYLYALTESNGSLLWRTVVGVGSQNSPVVSGDSVFAGGTAIYRINSSTGQKIWGTYVGHMDFSPLVVGRRVFAAVTNGGISKEGVVYGLDASSGAVLWRYNTSSPYDMAYANGLLYASSNFDYNGTTYNFSIFALNATDGSLVWSRMTPYDNAGGPTVEGGVLYVSGGVSSLLIPFLALNASTGNVIWQTKVPAVGPPAIAYGMLFLDGGSGVFALNQTTGTFIWGYDFHGFGISLSAPAVAEGLVFVGGGTRGEFADPTIYALEAKTGKLVWSLPVGVAANGSPAVAGGVVFVGADDGKLYAIGQAASGLPLGLILTGAGIASILVIALFLRRRRRRNGAEERILPAFV